MRFIYECKYFRYFDMISNAWKYRHYIYTLEDTQDNIIWLINSQKSYEEMREYYVKN